MASFYRDIAIVQTPGQPDYRASVLLPTIPPQSDDWLIETKLGDRYDLLAYRYWNDVSYWRYIPMINNLPADTLMIEAGTFIRIPRDIIRIENAMATANLTRSF